MDNVQFALFILNYLLVLEDLATGGGDEMVFDEGLNISGDEAKQTASQLKNSNVQVDSGGVDRMKNLDPETLAALYRLGIDVKSARPPYKGTRGGVKPGETVKVGDLDFKIDGLSSVEIGSRDQKAVYMQVPDAALGAEGSSGRLDQKVVATVIGANIGAFKTCFERRLREIPDLSGRVFVQFTIKTDGLRSYLGLGGQGYRHDRIIATRTGIPEKLRWIQISISNLKALIGGTHHGLGRADGKHLQAYLDEYAYRYDRRHRPDTIFERCVVAAATCPVWTYRDIVGVKSVSEDDKLQVA